jgi:hypothetical protein
MSLVKLCFFAVYALAVFQTKKLDEHQWLCSLRKPSNMHSYFCRSCNRQFVMEDDHNKHEFLCSLSYHQDHASFVNFAVLALEFIAMHPLFNMKSIVRKIRQLRLHPLFFVDIAPQGNMMTIICFLIHSRSQRIVMSPSVYVMWIQADV